MDDNRTPTRHELYQLARGISELADAVAGMHAGRVDRITVDRVAGDVFSGPRSRRDFVTPVYDVSKLLTLKGAQLASAAHEYPPSVGAALLGVAEADVRHWQQKGDELRLLSEITGRSPRSTHYFSAEFVPAARAALDTLTTGQGSDFVPTRLSGDLIERVNLGLLVAALFQQIGMPTNPFDIPGLAITRMRTGRASENISDTGQAAFKTVTPETRKIRLTAQKLGALALISAEAEEDAIVGILPFMRDELAKALSFDIEDAIVNGDTDPAHMDADVVDSDDPRTSWEGLRKLALSDAKADAGNTALTATMLLANRRAMGLYGARSDQIAHVVSVAGYVDLLADPSVITMDKYGPAATIVTGELAKCGGIPVIVSEAVRQDLNASGVNDGTITNRTLALTVYTPGFLLGERRGISIQTLVELYSIYDQLGVTASIRKAFVPRYPADTEPLVALTYNVKA